MLEFKETDITEKIVDDSHPNEYSFIKHLFIDLSDSKKIVFNYKDTDHYKLCEIGDITGFVDHIRSTIISHLKTNKLYPKTTIKVNMNRKSGNIEIVKVVRE